MEKQLKECSELVITAVLAGTALVLVVVLVFTQALLDSRYKRYETPAPIVLEFLDKYIPLESKVEQERTIEEYFSCVDLGSLLYDGSSLDLIRINSVLIEHGAVTYRICSAQKNYVEFMLLDGEGNDCPCRVGMFYQIGGDGRISSYNLFRLQPVSRKDSEWNGAWL